MTEPATACRAEAVAWGATNMVSSFNSYATGMLDVLSAEAREALLATGSRVRLHDGQLLQSRGAETAGLAVVLHGRVRMMTIGKDGSALLTAIIGPGQQFNEVTLFAGAAQTHDAAAVGETELLVLTAAEYKALARRCPEVVQALLISNVHRVHQLVETLNDLRALPKPVVLARLLLKNARYARAGSDTNRVEIEITQEDIAMFLGVSRAYLNKVFRHLCARNLIELSYRRVHVLDMTALEAWIGEHLTYDPVDGASEVIALQAQQGLD